MPRPRIDTTEMTDADKVEFINKQREKDRKKYYNNIEVRRERSKMYMRKKRELLKL